MALTVDERKKLDEIHAQLSVLVERNNDHETVLFGPGRRNGLVSEVQTLSERWQVCPARLRAARENRMFAVAVLSLIVAVGGLAATAWRLTVIHRQIQETSADIHND
ncbi:MAG: hypothetical protein WC977_01415 [Anaerovoracaceae bacterium]|jgi:hypothetical protein